ncbi:C-reactive protein-like [Lissotriton helveticus]
MRQMELGLLLISIFGAASQAIDMNGMLFLFPRESDTDQVILEPQLAAPMKGFTVCLRAVTELTRSYSLFSVSSRTHENMLLLFVNEGKSPSSVTVGGQDLAFSTLGYSVERRHICTTWDSSTGVTQLWINGNPLPRKVLMPGYSIQGPLKVILGQEQDSFGGSFDAKQSFIGEIGDVHMWDYVLAPADIHQAFINNKHLYGNVINWRALSYTMKGNVLVEPVQQSSWENPACNSMPMQCKAM